MCSTSFREDGAVTVGFRQIAIADPALLETIANRPEMSEDSALAQPANLGCATPTTPGTRVAKIPPACGCRASVPGVGFMPIEVK